MNQCLENYLRCKTFHEPKKWTSWLSLAEFWYNTAFHTSLQISPFQDLYGFPPPQISELAIPGLADLDAQQFLEAKQAMLRQLKMNLSQAQARMKKYADMNRTERTFQTGDMVYLKMEPYRLAAFGFRGPLKLHSKYYGPFRILNTVGNMSYKLLLPDGFKIHPVFHVSQLKKDLGLKVVPNPDLPLTDADGTLKTEPALVSMLGRSLVTMSLWCNGWCNGRIYHLKRPLGKMQTSSRKCSRRSFELLWNTGLKLLEDKEFLLKGAMSYPCIYLKN